ncbi:MAG TPA: hypothetical protein VFY59_01720 [Rubrobacter sp.]|nr:hypothetical protein [Rubrobacter sp.]
MGPYSEALPKVREGMTPEENAATHPPGYLLDESNPDIVTLRRKDGTFVAAFSTQGATKEGIRDTAMEDSGNPTSPRKARGRGPVGDPARVSTQA